MTAAGWAEYLGKDWNSSRKSEDRIILPIKIHFISPVPGNTPPGTLERIVSQITNLRVTIYPEKASQKNLTVLII